jgi:hypothetical protein
MKNSKITLKFVFSLLAFALVFAPGQAQIHVQSDGDVGIGTTSPSAKLDVVLDGNINTYSAEFRNNNTWNSSKYGLYNYISSSGTGTRYGLLSYVYGASTASNYGHYHYTSGGNYIRGIGNVVYQSSGATSTCYGQYNYTSAYTSSTGYGNYNYLYSPSSATGTRYGLYNNVYNYGNGTTYALYSSVNSGTGTRYAGYFNGDVHVNGNLTWTSDERTKKNVNNLSGALALVNALQPKSYEFKGEAGLNLPEGEQYGFLAQELEQVMPGLVKTIEHPQATEDNLEPVSEEAAANGETGEPAIEEGETQELKAVNYVALIPVLVQAIKEQQQEIEALKEQLRNK